MIKYANLKGFRNLGEVYRFGHIYRFYRKENNKNLFLFINAYESVSKLWIGYLDEKFYKNIQLNEQEEKYIVDELKIYIGEPKRIKDFKRFVKGTCIENDAIQIDIENNIERMEKKV